MRTETVPASALDARQRIIVGPHDHGVPYRIEAISDTTFAGTLVARTLYLRGDGGERRELTLNPDDTATRVVGDTTHGG